MIDFADVASWADSNNLGRYNSVLDMMEKRWSYSRIQVKNI